MWVKGQSGNPTGRKPGGRATALNLLNSICADNIAVIEAALRECLRKDPVAFYNTYVMPFAPKRITLTSDEDAPLDINIMFTKIVRTPVLEEPVIEKEK